MVPIGKEGNTVSYFFWKQENEGFESSERRRFQTNNLFFASDSPQTDIKGLHFRTLFFFVPRLLNK